MNFNLDSLALKDTTELQLLHPASDEPLFADKDEKQPVAIILYGTSSKQYRNAISAMQHRQLKRPKNAKVTPELLREESVNLLVACSHSAINFEYNGKPVEGEDAFRALYSDPKFSWLKEQVDGAFGDVSRFLDQ